METIVTQTLRPLRLLFLIKPNINSAFLEALKVCSGLWGGASFPILPLRKRFSNQFRAEYDYYGSPIDFYRNAINNFDPDYIVTELNFESEFINNLRGDRKVLDIDMLIQGINNNEVRFGVGFDCLLETLLRNEFKFKREDETKILLPLISDRELFCSVLFGNIGRQKVQSMDVPGQCVLKRQVNIGNLSEYYLDTFLPPLKICSYKLQSFRNPFWSGSHALYFIDHNRVQDLIDYWNLRALGWNIVAIPYTLFETPFYQRVIDDQLSSFLRESQGFEWITVLISRAIDDGTKNVIEEFIRRKAPIPGENEPFAYSFQWWYPRFWEESHALAYDRAASTNLVSAEKIDLLQLSSPKMDIGIIESPFPSRYNRHGDPIYKVQISQSYSDYDGKFAEVLPELDSIALEVVTRGSGFNQWRFSEKGSFYLVLGNEVMISTYFPDAFRVFEVFFKARGFHINFSSVGRLGTRLLENIGGILGVNAFMAAEVLEIFKLFENGKFVSKQQLFGLVTRYKAALQVSQPKQFVKSMLDKKIIEFGSEIQCGVCNQHSFYTLTDIKISLTCPICRNSFPFPSYDPDAAKWAYKGIGAFSRNNSADGLMCVFMLLRFFRVALASIDGGITPILSFEIKKAGAVDHEADLALFYKTRKGSLGRPDLIFCECKTVQSFEEKDIERMRRFARNFPGCVLTFATLKEELSLGERRLISGLASSLRNGSGLSDRPLSPILVLTRSELTERIGELAFQRLGWGMRRRFNDQLGSLADATCMHYLGMESYEEVKQRRFEALIQKRKQFDRDDGERD